VYGAVSTEEISPPRISVDRLGMPRTDLEQAEFIAAAIYHFRQGIWSDRVRKSGQAVRHIIEWW
jgi:hypothetical protein